VSTIVFLLLGLGSGSAFALLGLGLILEYRSSGVVNFAHGAIAMYITYVYVELRDNGELVFPVLGFNHINLSAAGLGFIASAGISLVYAAVLGLLIYLLVFRPLRHWPALARIAASVGLMLALQAIAVLNFGTATFSVDPILPVSSLQIGSLRVPLDQVYLAGIAVAISGLLAVVYRRTRFGIATTAAAEDEVAASLAGLSPSRIAALNWVIASVLAGAAGILIAPITTLSPATYTLFIVPVLGAALLGRFRSFTVTTAVGLALGMLASVLLELQAAHTWLPSNGTQEGLPFLLILFVMYVGGRALPERGAIIDRRLPSVGSPARILRSCVVSLAVGAAAVLLLPGGYRAGLISSLVAACVCMSFVVLTGYLGQVSLAQLTFAGIGGFTLGHLSVSLGIGFPFAPILAGLLTVPAGLLVGLPALRVRGVNLAVVTLAAAAAVDALLFNGGWFSGGFSGQQVPSPHIGGLNLGIAAATDTGYPRAAFGLVALVVLVLLGVLVARLRGSPAGRQFLAVRSNERAAASIGINVAGAKLLAFGMSAFIAGVGGALIGYQQRVLTGDSFDVFTSLSFLAMAYIGGIGRISGAVAAGMLLAPGGLAVTIGDHFFALSNYQLLIGGVGLIFMVIRHPNGLVPGGLTWAGLEQRFRPSAAAPAAPAPPRVMTAEPTRTAPHRAEDSQ
jgi:ABC-type branched-subunit amino acid transport system permease subunit